MSERPAFEQFYAYRRFLPVTQFLPGGERLLFVSELSGQFNLWAAAVDGSRREQLTAFSDNTVRAAAVNAAGAILFVADQDGDEFHQLHRISAGGGRHEQLTELPGVQHTIGPDAWSPNGTSFAFSANSRTLSDSEIFVWGEDDAEPRHVFGEGMYAFPGEFSPDCSKLLAVELRSNSDQSIHVVDLVSGRSHEVTPHAGQARFIPGPWSPDGSGFYLLSDEGREFVGLAFQELESGRRQWVEAPERDIDELAGSRDGRVLAWLENDDGWARLRVRDRAAKIELPAPQLPRGAVSPQGSGMSLAGDGSRLALIWEQPTRPAEIYVVDTATGDTRAMTESRAAAFSSLQLREPEAIRYESFDGRRIPAWLYRPHAERRVPYVIAIHGGPEAQERPIYRPHFQYLLSRGIGVLAPNSRGSTGYGKSYQRLIHHDWGGGDLEDWRHAVLWLASRELADRDRLGVFGGSYGGFATLTCVTRLPELWKAAVDIVGPANLVTFVRAVPPQWTRLMAEWVGDPDAEEDFLRERSPMTYVDRVSAALLVIQGANDPRVVRSESDRLVERLRALGREVEYVVFEDEGHGFTRHVNEVRAHRLTCEWFERQLSLALLSGDGGN